MFPSGHCLADTFTDLRVGVPPAVQYHAEVLDLGRRSKSGVISELRWGQIVDREELSFVLVYLESVRRRVNFQCTENFLECFGAAVYDGRVVRV